MMDFTFYKPNEISDDKLQIAVIAARYQGKWIFCRHKQRVTWEMPGGHKEQGETIEEAAKRELREETGLTLDPALGKCVISFRRDNSFVDVWLFQQDFDLHDVVLQEGETCDKMYAGVDEVKKLSEKGIFVPYSYLPEFLNMVTE